MDKRIVIAGGLRTAIGHFSKSLARIAPEELMGSAIHELVKRMNLDPDRVDGVMVGWVGQGTHAPNIARIAALKGGRIPEKTHSMTIQANCLSGMEAISSAARRIVMGEGDLYIAGGTESMSTCPYAIRGSRAEKSLRSMDTIKENWASLWTCQGVTISDAMEEGLVDPVKNLNMAATAEVCAQMFGISRQAQDRYAHESFRRCLEGHTKGFYASHMMPVKSRGDTILEADEYVMLRRKLVEKPAMIQKASELFDSEAFTIKKFYGAFGVHIEGKAYSPEAKGTVTLFNSCVRSDGAAAVIVTSEENAKKLGLDILGVIHTWAYCGVNPAHMGIAPAFATQAALDRGGLAFSDLAQIELHEAFAATCLSVFKVGKEKFGHDWETAWNQKRLNPHGGSIPLGHPLAATGTRIVLNLLYAMKENPHARYGLATACASGGLGGAMIVEKP